MNDGRNDDPLKIFPVDGYDEGGAYYKIETINTALERILARQGKSYKSILHEGEAQAKQAFGRQPKGFEDLSHEWDDMIDGVGVGAKPRDIAKVAEGCPHIADTLAAGGANLINEPQWRNVLRVADRCEDREGTAARLCEKGPGYSYEGTILKLAVVTKNREENKRGFPTCADIELNGAPQCATCKYRKFNKSPLNTPEANEVVAKLAGFQQGVKLRQDAVDAHYGLIPEAMGEDGAYQPIPGGYYEASDENIARLNNRFRLVNEGPDTMWWEHRGKAGWIERPEKDLQRGLGNVFVRIEKGDGERARRSASLLFPWFHAHKERGAPLQAVFKANQPRSLPPASSTCGRGGASSRTMIFTT
jgi:hypothetical protein